MDALNRALDAALASYFVRSVPEHNAAFRLQLELYLFENHLDRATKFIDLPFEVQSNICQKAALIKRGPSN